MARWCSLMLAGSTSTLLAGCSATDPDALAGDGALALGVTAAAAVVACPAPGPPPVVVTETQGPYGTISIFPDAVFGDFYASGTILRASDSTACVGRIRPIPEPKALVGEMKVTSPYLALTGAPSATVILDQDVDNEYVFFGGPPFVYPTDRSVSVRVETTGGSGLPALPPTELRSSPFPFLEVIKPVIPPVGELVIPSDEDFRVLWKPPVHGKNRSADGADWGREARVVVSLWFIAGFTLDGEIRCGFPVSAGRGVIPESLLREMRERISPDAPIVSANLNVFLGDQREVRPGGASYVIELGPFDNTTVGQKQVTLD